MRWVGRHWAQLLSVAVHAALLAVLIARYEPAPAAPAVVRIELELSQPAPEAVAAVEPPAEPRPEPLPEPAAERPQVAEEPPPEPLPEPPAEPPPEPPPLAAVEPPPIAEEPLPPATAPVVAMVPPPPIKPRPPEAAKRPLPPAEALAVLRDVVPPPTPPPHPTAAPAPVRAAGPPPDYLARLQARLSRYKTYPRAAQIAREEGTVLLRFTVARDGTVVSWRIERSSGHESLDRQVGTMIERAAPMPPVPDSLPGDRLDVVLPVQFTIR